MSGRRLILVVLALAVACISTPAAALAPAGRNPTFQATEQPTTTLWSAVLVPGDTTATGPHGYCRADDDGFCIKRPHHGRLPPHGSLTDDTVEIHRTVHRVQSLRYGAANPDGKLHLTVDPPFASDDRNRLVLQIGTRSFPLSSAFADVWKIGGNYTWTGFEEPWDVGKPIEVSLKGPPPGYAGHTPDTANPRLRLGVSNLSWLETADDRDWYRVELETDRWYRFHTRGPSLIAYLDWYQLDLDTDGSYHRFTRGPGGQAGSLRIALYDQEGEEVWRDGAPVADATLPGGRRAEFHHRPSTGGAYYLEVSCPTNQPPTWYMISYTTMESLNRP